MLSWHYDMKIETQGIRFILFGIWTLYVLRAENIEYATEIGRISPGSWNAYNFKNRFFARSFMIVLRNGWFARKILVTPKTPSEFLTGLKELIIKIH